MRGPRTWIRLAVAACAVTLVLGTQVGGVRRAGASSFVPAQLVAKMYSEALGRMPDSGGWSNSLALFANQGCSQATVSTYVQSFYTSSEYLNLPYDNGARLLTLYRGALNREPDQSGFDAWSANLDNRVLTWPQVVQDFVASNEFDGLVPAICSRPATFFGGTQPAAPPVTGTGLTGTEAQLQSALDGTPSGGAVSLAREAVVTLTSTLVIPAGVTLTTTGAPPANEYALQGRLVRANLFNAPLVEVMGGGRLRNVWVDGERGDPSNYVSGADNIEMMGGTGTEVSGIKDSDTTGWTSLAAFGTFENLPCGGATISDNLVTAYSSNHDPSKGNWSDGISVACENATVERNSVIDPTDCGFVLFRAYPATQRSQIGDNQLLSAGNSAWCGMGMDGLTSPTGQPVTESFQGASFTRNTFWSGPNTSFAIGMTVGTRAWFGTRSLNGSGGSFTDNTTNGMVTNMGTGIAVAGMLDATVQGNDLRTNLVPADTTCPQVAIGVDPAASAGSSVQPGWVSAVFTNSSGNGCI